MIKIILFVVAGLAVGAGLAAAALMGVLPVPLPFGPAADARKAADASKPLVTVMYPTHERIVNLTDKSTPRYLKVALTLEFIDTKVKDPPKGDAVKAQQD